MASCECEADNQRNSNNLLESASGTNTPRIVKFGFKDFKVRNERWHAACNTCNKQLINASEPEELSLTTLANSDRFTKLKELFSRVFCCPATSAPVERVFSQSGLIVRPHRARMTDQLLETLVFLKCNNDA